MKLASGKSSFKLPELPNTLFFAGLIILVSVLPFSEYIISLSQFILAGSWLLSGNFTRKIQRLKKNKLFWIVAGVYLMHVLGILYTADIQYALKDLRIKVPLFLLPLLFAASKPLNNKQFKTVLFFFVAAVTLAAIYAFGNKTGMWTEVKSNARDASQFISHIRFSLMICFAIFILLYFLKESRTTFIGVSKYMTIGIIVLLIFILVYIPFFTGVFVLIITAIGYYLLFHFKQANKAVKIISVIVLIVLPIAAFSYLNHLGKQVHVPNNTTLEPLDAVTSLGNPYSHQPNNPQAENGYQVYTYICEQELESAWNGASQLDYRGVDNKNNELKITLFRFLSSKGLRKDVEGFNQLSKSEIEAIENSVSNVSFLSGSQLKHRIYQTVWEYYMNKGGKNPSGHSAMMRLAYWETATHMIKNNFLIGVGTGDIIDEFENAYQVLDTKLSKRHQRRSHNQYLSITVTFGIIGLSYYLFSLIYPLINYPNEHYKLYVVFAIICLLSMITEDTIETQVGVTFFAFFNSLFLFLAPKKIVDNKVNN